VGQNPTLEPGEHFEYTSFCPLPTPIGSMHGTYQMVAAGGQEFDAEIAPFSLAVPTALN
jgi:ApaG protein